ncbi:ATP-binding protein [Nonomuraea sp. M3C6]|uniref:ATP-binding protein n=1 Tax=Nonomuraea marmarensis TaxID=3351344 RepID=A0ABW7AM93_9ACTN
MTAVITSTSRGRQMGRLPAEVTSFVGRRHEVAEVKQLLSASRAVTLTGVGGVGKTRLALRVGHEVRRAFRDGVWLVELAALQCPDLLAQVVAEALEIRGRTAGAPMTVLTEHLRDKQALVILDNCEHLVGECAVLAETLLRAAGEVRILATSRQAMGLVGEQVVPVPTLSLPECPEWDVPRPWLGAPVRGDPGEAVRLFAERARAVLPAFAVTEDNREVVAGIVRRLDGLPLGIELAAVRLRALSAQQLLDRLENRFRLLTGGSRAVLPRHQTLRALIDWSYTLCSDKERLLWERASVFAGGLDLEAAEAVCSGAGIAREDVVDLVIGLVDKSVLLREDHRDGVRYRILETLREYGRERLLASGQEDRLRRRHAGYYRELAARARAELFGPGQVAWLTRLQVEHANLRTALNTFSAAPSGAETCLSMATDLLYHWITSYYLGEGRGWLERGLAAGEATGEEVRARALWAGGWLAIIQADIPAATALLRESRRLGERLGDESVLGYVALFSGMTAMWDGRAGEAIERYEEALPRHRGTGDPIGLSLALVRLSLAHSFLGESSAAVAAGEESLAISDAYGEGWHRAYTMMALGVEVWRQGDLARAAELESQSLAFNRSMGDWQGVGITVEVLAWIAASGRQCQRAARLLGIAQNVWSSLGAAMSGFGHLTRYHDECAALCRETLGEAGFAAAVRRGGRLPCDEALAYALQEDIPGRDGNGQGEAAPLTRREREIAALVARGMTNREIAASLVIAQRTAECHIEHILTKLGFSSRAQIAVWVGERARQAESGGEEPGGERRDSRNRLGG